MMGQTNLEPGTDGAPGADRHASELSGRQMRHAPGGEDHLDLGEMGSVALEVGRIDDLWIKLGQRRDALAPAIAEDLAVARRIVVEQESLDRRGVSSRLCFGCDPRR